MEKKNEKLLDELEEVLLNKELPEAFTFQIVLGNYDSRVPLAEVQANFKSIRIQFTNTDYSYLQCKVTEESSVTFELRVKNSELVKVTEIKEVYALPTEAKAPIEGAYIDHEPSKLPSEL